MSLCTISITAKTAAGAALPGAVLTFTKSPGDRLTADDGAAIWPLSVQVSCDASGLGSVSLLPGDYVCQSAGPVGSVRQLITVPDVIATTLDVLIGSTGLTFETITWATYAALVATTVAPWPSVAAGVAGTADGSQFIAVSEGGVRVFKRAGAIATPCFIDL
jgi:hypothetical protein